MMFGKRLWGLVEKDEVITVAELYQRFFGTSGNYVSHRVFVDAFILNCNRLEIIQDTPYKVKRKLTFFEKILDKRLKM